MKESIKIKRFIFIAVVFSILFSCHDPAGNNSNGNPNEPNNNKKTYIQFDNTQGICAVSVYKNSQRREEDKIAVIPVGGNSKRIEWTPSAYVPFYYTYSITFKGISNFTIDYIPEPGKDQNAARIDAEKTTIIKVPTLSETISSPDKLLSNRSYLLIQNNSSFSFELLRGPTTIPTDNLSNSLVNSKERAQYTINPGLVSHYKLLIWADYKEFPSSIVNFEAGHVYIFDYNGNISLVRDIELKLENVNGFAVPQPPAAPVVITSNGSITLQWTSVENATAYEIWMATVNDSASASKYGADVEALLSTTISGLNNGSIYYFWLKAKNNLGTSGFSPVVSGTPSAVTYKPPSPQTAPTIFAGNGQLTVSWQAVADASAYEVWLGTTNNTTSAKKQSEDILGLSTIITDLNNGTTYYVWIKAKNHIGVSGFSPSAYGSPFRSPGLYNGTEKIGNHNLSESLSYISANAITGDNYFIVLGSDESVSGINLNYGKTISITLLGTDVEKSISLNENGKMFTVSNGVTLTIDKNITIFGQSNNYDSLLFIDGGKLIINNGVKICGNMRQNNNINLGENNNQGGGITVKSGVFTMNGGIISGNTAYMGGGIYVINGTVNINNGTIIGNSAGYGGGGICIYNGVVTMNNGTINENSAYVGGGIYIYKGGNFKLVAGTVNNNSSSAGSSYANIYRAN